MTSSPFLESPKWTGVYSESDKDDFQSDEDRYNSDEPRALILVDVCFAEKWRDSGHTERSKYRLNVCVSSKTRSTPFCYARFMTIDINSPQNHASVTGESIRRLSWNRLPLYLSSSLSGVISRHQRAVNHEHTMILMMNSYSTIRDR